MHARLRRKLALPSDVSLAAPGTVLRFSQKELSIPFLLEYLVLLSSFQRTMLERNVLSKLNKCEAPPSDVSLATPRTVLRFSLLSSSGS